MNRRVVLAISLALIGTAAWLTAVFCDADPAIEIPLRVVVLGALLLLLAD